MTILRYEGTVSISHYNEGEVSIGEKNIILELIQQRDRFKGYVTVSFADESFTGDLYVLEGNPGYSEWTPGDPAELGIGNHDIMERLEEYEGKQIILWIADEPINTLDPPPSWANIAA